MGFKRLFCGFIFLFDVRINGLDILPDIVGYISFFLGLSILEKRNKYFSRAKRFAFPMIFISIMDIYQVTAPVNKLGSTSWLGLYGVLFDLISGIIHLLMVYNICLGIAKEARLINDSELESKTIISWKLYLLNNVLIIIGMLLTSLIGSLIGILYYIILIISILSSLLMIGLMNTASYTLE